MFAAPRSRIYSAHTDAAISSHTVELKPMYAGAGSDSDAILKSLVNERYNIEYKMDRRIRAKALEVLQDFYAKQSTKPHVSQFPLFLPGTATQTPRHILISNSRQALSADGSVDARRRFSPLVKPPSAHDFAQTSRTWRVDVDAWVLARRREFAWLLAASVLIIYF